MYDAGSIASKFFDEVVKRHEFNKKTNYYTGPQKVEFELCMVKPGIAKYYGIKAVVGKDCELHKEIYTNYTKQFIEEIFEEIRGHLAKEGYSIEDPYEKSFYINLA